MDRKYQEKMDKIDKRSRKDLEKMYKTLIKDREKIWKRSGKDLEKIGIMSHNSAAPKAEMVKITNNTVRWDPTWYSLSAPLQIFFYGLVHLTFLDLSL